MMVDPEILAHFQETADKIHLALYWARREKKLGMEELVQQLITYGLKKEEIRSLCGFLTELMGRF